MQNLKSHKMVALAAAIQCMIKDKINEKCDSCKTGKEIIELNKMLIKETSDIMDEGFLTETKESGKINVNRMLTLIYVNGAILTFIVAFLTMLFMAVQTLESKVFPSGQLFTKEVRK